jgi:hypothetical protein
MTSKDREVGAEIDVAVVGVVAVVAMVKVVAATHMVAEVAHMVAEVTIVGVAEGTDCGRESLTCSM